MSFPLWGEYLVVQIDPVATLQLLLDDPQVLEECKALKTKKYVACRLQSLSFPILGTLCPIQIGLVSHGLVPGLAATDLPDMSFPISPNTSHPRARRSLGCTPPLPWENCFQSTQALVAVRVKYTTRDNRDVGKYAISEDEACGLALQVQFDKKWREKLARMTKTGGTDFEPDSHLNPFALDEEVEEEYDDDEGEEEDYDEDLRSVEESHNRDRSCNDDDANAPSGSQAGLPAPAEHSLVIQRSVERDDYASPSLDASTAAIDLDNFRYQHDFTPVIDFSVDLEQLPVSEISNPWSFFHEISALESIRARYEARMRAKIEATNEANAAAFDAKVEERRIERQTVLSPTQIGSAKLEVQENKIYAEPSQSGESAISTIARWHLPAIARRQGCFVSATIHKAGKFLSKIWCQRRLKRDN